MCPSEACPAIGPICGKQTRPPICYHPDVPRLLLTLLVGVVLLGVPVAGQNSVARPAVPVSADRAAIDRAIAAVYPSLVRISVVALQWTGGRELKLEASGSGTIVTADGFVVTNHHVAGRVQRIVCTLPSNEEVPAELIGTDPLSDIAVLKLTPVTPRTFPAARFGSSAALRQGDVVLAMGSPLALSQSVTRGIVSNLNMMMPSAFGNALGLLDGEDVGSVVKWIGHDAAIYPGNSGGPLVNLAGEIVGVNEISFGLGGAIPADLAKSIFEAIKREGRVRRSWIGIEMQPRVSGMTTAGALISWVAPKSAAEAAGLKTGDLLMRVNSAPVDVKFAEQLPAVNQLLFGLTIGKPAALVVRRDGKDITANVTPAERPVASSMPTALNAWGLVGADISASEAREMGRATTDGIRVVNLRPGGPSEQAKPPLSRGDVIVEVDGQPVWAVADLNTRTQAALGAKPKASVLVGFDRGLERRLTVIEIGQPRVDPPPSEASKAWVPVNVQVLTPTLAERLGLKGKTGVRVTRVLDSASPLKVGDIILAIDGEPVRATAPNDEEVFAAAIRRYRIGSTVTLTVYRANSESPLPVVLGTSPRLAREMLDYTDQDFEFRARNVAASDQDDPRFGHEVTRGVIVESVSQGGWAALARMQVGDLILAVDGRTVANVDELAARMKEVVARRPPAVVFHLRRGIRTLFIEIKPSWK
jgi:serine protease Do